MRLDDCTIDLTQNLLWLPAALSQINLLIMIKLHYSLSLGKTDHRHPRPSILPSWGHLLWPTSVGPGRAISHQGVLTLKRNTQEWLNQREEGLGSNNCPWLRPQHQQLLPPRDHEVQRERRWGGGQFKAIMGWKDDSVAKITCSWRGLAFSCQNPNDNPNDWMLSSEFQGH